MVGFKKTCAVGLLLCVPFIASGQDIDSSQQTTVEWRQIAESSIAAGAFVGVHNDTLIVAGGIGNEGRADIRAATRDADSISWQDTMVELPGGRAFGTSASHALGMFVIGGSDGNVASSAVTRIRWNPETQSPDLFNLPPIPGELVTSEAAVLGNTLYVLTNKLYAFDLGRIETNEPGSAPGPWQELPSLPLPEGDIATRKDLVMVAQNNGRGDRLYVADGRGESTELWEYDPGAAAWSAKADASIDGQAVDIRDGSAVALGQSHILL